MVKEIECPEDLGRLLKGLRRFKYLGKEASDIKGRHVTDSQKLIEAFTYADFVQEYIEEQNVLSELLQYCSSEEEIRENLKGHVRGCQDCSNTYLNFEVQDANAFLNGLRANKIPGPEEKKREYLAMGLVGIVKELDNVDLRLLL